MTKVLALGGDALVLEQRVGEGRFVAAALLPFLSNQGIGKADNAVLGVNLITRYVRGGSVLFNEFVHGYRERSRMWALLLAPPGLWLVLQVLILFAALFARGFVRFGPPRPEPPPPPRSRDEYVDAMAAFLHRVRAFGLAARHLKDGFREEIRRRYIGPVPANPEEVVEHARRVRPELAGDLDTLFEAREERMTESVLLSLQDDIQHLRERMRHENSGSL
jgi:hypothetical protein